MNCKQCGAELASVPVAPVPPWIGHKLPKSQWIASFIEFGTRQQREEIACYVQRLEDRFNYVTEQLKEHGSCNYQ